MKVKEILKEALGIVGFSYSQMIDTMPFSADCLSLINVAFIDIGKEKVTDLETQITLNKKEYEVLLYGIARAVTLYLGDTIKNAAVTDIYNAKRKAFLSGVAKIKNVNF